PTIIAKTLKPPIKAPFMFFLLWTTHAAREEKHEFDVPNCQVKFSLNVAAAWLLARNETAERPSATPSARSGRGTGVFVWERGGSRKRPDMMTSNWERHVCLKFLSTIHSIACGRRGHARDVGW